MPGRQYLLTPWLIRAMLPTDTIGTYTLWSGATPVYIGRSDTCLRRRLLEHSTRRPYGTRFTFDVSRTPQDAFAMECSLFHALGDTTSNIEHPPRANRADPACPFCRGSLTAIRNNRLQTRETHQISTTAPEGTHS